MLISWLLSVCNASSSSASPSWLISGYRPNPFKNANIYSFAVDRNQRLERLWGDRFAIPILYGFSDQLYDDIKPSVAFDASVVDEMYPLLLMPQVPVGHLGNPFPGVDPKHYCEAECPFDLNQVLLEIFGAYKEGAPIDWPALAKRYSLLHTMASLEEYVRDFGDADFDLELQKFSLQLKADLDQMALQVYRGTSDFRRPNPLFAAVAEEISGMALFEKLTGNPQTWSLMKPLLTKADRLVLANPLFQQDLIFLQPSNHAFVAQMLLEDASVPLTKQLASKLDLTFFRDFMTEEQRNTFLSHQLKPLVSKGDAELTDEQKQALKQLVDTFSPMLVSDKLVEEISVEDPFPDFFPHGLGCFIARRMVAQAEKGKSKYRFSQLRWKDFHLDLPDLLTALDSRLFEITSEQQANTLNVIAENLKELRNPKEGELSMNSDDVTLCLYQDPCLLLPKNLMITGTCRFLAHMILIWERALKSQHGPIVTKMAKHIPPELFKWKNYGPQVAQLEDKDANVIVNIQPACLWEVVKRKGISFLEILKPNDFFFLEHLEMLSRSLIIEQMGDKEEMILKLASSSLLDVSSKEEQLPLLAHQFTASSALRDSVVKLAYEILNSITDIKDSQHYLDLVQVLFEDLPLAMSDEELTVYLQTLIKTISPPMSDQMEVDVPGEKQHPLYPELRHMREHLYEVLRDRVISRSLVNSIGQSLKELLLSYEVKGTILAIQLSESKREFKRACHRYFDKCDFYPELWEKLLKELNCPEKTQWLLEVMEWHMGRWMEWDYEPLAKFLGRDCSQV